MLPASDTASVAYRSTLWLLKAFAPLHRERVVWARLAGWMLLVALLVQGEAVRIHAVHHEGQAIAQRLAEGPVQRKDTTLVKPANADGDAQGICPLCREDMAFGQYLVPGAVVLPEPLGEWGVPGVVCSAMLALPIASGHYPIRAPPGLPG